VLTCGCGQQGFQGIKLAVVRNDLYTVDKVHRAASWLRQYLGTAT
jgi:hypothetical protein